MIPSLAKYSPDCIMCVVSNPGNLQSLLTDSPALWICTSSYLQSISWPMSHGSFLVFRETAFWEVELSWIHLVSGGSLENVSVWTQAQSMAWSLVNTEIRAVSLHRESSFNRCSRDLEQGRYRRVLPLLCEPSHWDWKRHWKLCAATQGHDQRVRSLICTHFS